MKLLEMLNQDETFELSVPIVAGDRIITTNHQLTFVFSADVSVGSTLTLYAYAYGVDVAEAVASGALDAVDLAGEAKTLTVKDALFDRFRVELSGFAAGSVDLHYIGFAANDIGIM